MERVLLGLSKGICTGICMQTTVCAAPDAGSLQPPAWPERVTTPPPKPLQLSRDPEASEPSPTEPLVNVIGFLLDGNPRITEEQFAAAVAPFMSRPVSYAELLAAAQAVALAYRQAGWVVSTTLPPQDIRDGIVRIAVTQAVFGGVEVTGTQASDNRAVAVERYLMAQQAPAQDLRVDRLDRAMLLINDLPGVSAISAMREGLQPGETDLVVQLGSSGSHYGDVSLDNSGTRPAGYQRVLANWNLAGVLRWGDQLSASLIHSFTEYQSDGSDYQRVVYSLPLGYEGWRLALGGSSFSYRLVSSEYSGLGFYGDSEAWDLELTYPLLRHRERNLYLVGKFEQTHIDNQGAWITVSRYRVESRSLGLRGNMFDGLGAGASSTGSLVVNAGFLDLTDSPTQSGDASTTATAGTFTRLRYSFTRDQGLGRGFSVLAALNGQTADKNLDSNQKFYLGGSNGVRAYPASEGSGYQGFVLSLEARWKPAADWQLAALYDYGYVTVNHDNDYSGASSLNDYCLRGYGLALAWKGKRQQTLSLTWARRIGENANATSAGKDQDGTYSRDRLWVNASLDF